MKNNRGVTLVEVIVIVAILGIVSGGIAFSYGLVNSANAEKASQSISGALEKVKLETMSKSKQSYLVLYKSSVESYEGYYIASTTDLSTFVQEPDKHTKIANQRMFIEVTLTDGVVLKVETTPVYLSFDRSTGAFIDCLSGSDVSALETKNPPASIKVYGNGKERVITCITTTGKHYIE